jgi:hypothetical protein
MRNNYIDILRQKVEIPIIQRDYAQGRTDSKTNKIRRDFLDVLFEFVHQKFKNHNVEIELDYIYGFNKEDDRQASVFIPVDGQQRLTTLWLLYWMVAAKENVLKGDKDFLSNFVYETRHSTTQFFRELIRFTPAFSEESISLEVKNQPWYFETWNYDPSIQAMLVVMDDIEKRYAHLNNNHVWNLIGNTSCPFYFYKLDMKKMGLTDDLYIKMNSRGKALTEFEYFKVGFSEFISDHEQKERFEISIDGKWIEAIWHIVSESGIVKENDDIALIVDSAFLNLFNFITSVISFSKEIKTASGEHYSDTVKTPEMLKSIYGDETNLRFLIDTLDAICLQQNNNPTFWEDVFYFEKNDFTAQKTRLFFQHSEPNLLKRCLFHYSENSGFSFPEQLLLLGCFTHFKTPQQEFSKRIRIIRNLAVNSENELRESILGNSFDEVENFLLYGELSVFKNFKTDQINEEKYKEIFLQQLPDDKDDIYRLEDSGILRGSISLFPFDAAFGNRAKKFLELFDEDEFVQQFTRMSNLLLCFGDYTQDDGSLTNLMSKNKTVIRKCLTTPGYKKTQFYSKTQPVVMALLDFFITNPTVSVCQKISDTLSLYSANPKEWKYYFMKYESFREECNYGYYAWRDEQYCVWKMGKRQYNGYHWDPFLYEIKKSLEIGNLELDNYSSELSLVVNGDKLLISSISNGFLFKNGMGDGAINRTLDNLINDGFLTKDGKFEVQQDSGTDMEDRIEKVKSLIQNLINNCTPLKK